MNKPTRNMIENRILLYFASHSGRNISKLTEWLSLYFLATEVNGHFHLFIKSAIHSSKTAPAQYQTNLLTLLNTPA
jgi:hypothetical protein